MKFAKREARSTQRISRGKTELAFLPAALEIVETPAPPLAGTIGAPIIALFCLALAWASFGQIDIIASASGKDDKASGMTTSEPQGQELVYAARIALDSTQMRIDEDLVNLSPGMAVTVEIKTGSRTVITYLLSPLVRYSRESLRER
jgi:hypothetical protein